MSSRAVRTQIRTLLASPAVAALCPFYETINVEQNPTDATWFTVSFQFSYSEKLTMCDQFAEYGEVELVFEGLPGVGDDTVLQAAEGVTAELEKFRDSTGKLALTNFSAPDEFSEGGADSAAYRVAVTIEYVFNR
ncbi:MAG: hypothetical protein ACO25M_09350 [Limnohabitans sp.]